MSSMARVSTLREHDKRAAREIGCMWGGVESGDGESKRARET